MPTLVVSITLFVLALLIGIEVIGLSLIHI